MRQVLKYSICPLRTLTNVVVHNAAESMHQGKIILNNMFCVRYVVLVKRKAAAQLGSWFSLGSELTEAYMFA